MRASDYQAVKAMVAEYMQARGTRTTSWIQIDLAKQLEVRLDEGHEKYRGQTSRDSVLFEGRVRRALEELTTEGVLVKTIVHTHGRRKEAQYQTREAAQRVITMAEAEKAEAKALLARLQHVVGRLKVAGFDARLESVQVSYGKPWEPGLWLPVADAERVLRELEATR